VEKTEMIIRNAIAAMTLSCSIVAFGTPAYAKDSAIQTDPCFAHKTRSACDKDAKCGWLTPRGKDRGQPVCLTRKRSGFWDAAAYEHLKKILEQDGMWNN
jgi:hypothetical protein